MIDIYELIRELYRINNPDDEDIDNLTDTFLENYTYDYYECENFDRFCKLIDNLLELTPLLKSPLTGQLYHCFGTLESSGIFCVIIKKEHKND